jgi:hypothetical protein
MSTKEIKNIIKFDEIKQRKKNIFGCVANTVVGLYEAFDWV